MRQIRAFTLLFGLYFLLLTGCGVSGDELITAVIVAEDARTRLIAQNEIIKLGKDGIEVFAELLDFNTVRNLFEVGVSRARLSEMSEEDILEEVTDIRITAVQGMAAIGLTEAAQPLIDAAYLPKSQTEKLGEPISIGEDELSIEHAASFRREVMTALGQLAFGSEEEREKAIDLFSYGANDPDTGVRASTAGALAALHLHESSYFLKQLADDDAAVVRAAAFNAIHVIGSYYVDHAERSLSYGDEETAELDRRHLTFLKDSVIEYCINALEDPEPAVRIPAISALNVFDDTSSVTPLIRYLADANENVRIAIANTLSNFDTEAGFEAAKNAVIVVLGEADEPQRRMMAALVLGRMRTGGVALEKALLTPDELWFVKLQLINALANIGDEEYLNAVSKFLNDPDHDVQCAAINAVGALGSVDDLDRLIEYATADETLISSVIHAAASIAGYDGLQTYLSTDNDLVRRIIAIKTLSMQSNPESPPPPMLVDLLTDEDVEIVTAALDAVARYDFSQIADELTALTERGEEFYTIFGDTKDSFEDLSDSLNAIYSVKTKAAGLLASFDNRDGINYFIEMLEDPSEGRRLIGVASLGYIKHPRGVMPTVGLLNDGSDYVRWGATQMLGNLGDIRTTGFLNQSIKDANLWVQISAINSLLAIGDKNSLDDVNEILMKNAEPVVTVAALDLISRMGDKHMADDIAVYLKDSDAGVRFAAAICLTRLNDEKGRGIEFLKEALESTETVTINPGLPPISPMETGMKLLAAELTNTPESQIKDLVTKPEKVVSWAHATQILLGEIATAEAFGVVAEMTFLHKHLQLGLLDNMGEMRPTAYTAFEPFLGDGDAEMRQLGYDILVKIGGDRVLDRFMKQLSEYPQDAPALVAAIDSLGAYTRLRELFSTAEEPVRILVAQRWADWTGKRMPLLWGQIATEDQSLAVRMVVLNALAADPTGVGLIYLTLLIEDEDSPPELVSAAKDALAALELPPTPTEEPETVS